MTSPLNANLPPNLPPIGPRRVVYLEANRAPTPLDTKYRDGSYYEFNTEWRDKSTSPPNIYKLATILSKTNAVWVLISGGSSNIINIGVDAFTAPGTNPVQANMSGTITITGGQVAASVVGANVVRTNSLAANSFTVEIQQSGSTAAKNTSLNGVSHYNSNQFTIDEGFVSAKIGVASISSSLNNAGYLSANSSQFSVDVNGYLQLLPGATSYGVGNLSISYSTGVFTVAGYDGTALSVSNPGIVWLQDKANPGRLRRYLITANQSFTDGAAGQIDNMRWGVTSGVNWANNAPFYLYAVTNDALDTISFSISRVPNLTSSPIAAKLGKQGAIVNVSQSDMYLLANVTVADYEQNPCLLIGAFRMQFAGATDSWTVQPINMTDGIGRFHEGIWYTFPVGQMGNAANAYFLDNTGTAPQFTTSTVNYRISTTGELYFSSLHVNCSVGGAGAFDLTAALPLETQFNGSQGPFGEFIGTFNDTGVAGFTVVGALAAPARLVFSTDAAMTNFEQTNIQAGDSFQGYFTGLISIT